MSDTQFIAKTAEVAKRHGFKAAGATSLAAVILAGQAYFAPLSGHNEMRRDVQDLRERLGQLEWRHESEDREAMRRVSFETLDNAAQIVWDDVFTNAVISH